MADTETRDRDTSSEALMAALSEPLNKGDVDVHRTYKPASDLPPSRRHGWFLFFGFTAALIWAAGATAYIAAYTGIDLTDPLATHTPSQMAGLAIFALGPALLFIMASLIVRELRVTVDRTRGVEAALVRLAAPTEVAEA